MQYESVRTDLVSNTYAYAFTSNHSQPSTITCFKYMFTSKEFLPKDRRYDLEDVLWKERNNYA